MSPHSATLLVLVLCLGQMIHRTKEDLPRPSISAEPGHEIPWGMPVTIVCQSPVESVTLRLEHRTAKFKDCSNTSQARFFIPAMNESTAGDYQCLYQKDSKWSPRSETLKLVLSRYLPSPSISAEPGPVIPWGRPVTIVCQSPVESVTLHLDHRNLTFENHSNTSQARFFIPAMNESTAGDYQCLYLKDSKWSNRSETLKLVLSTEPGRKTHYLYIIIGVLVLAFLLCLFLFLYLHQKRPGVLSCKGQQQKPRERPSPGTDGLERRIPDIASADRLPVVDTGTETSTPAVGRPQEMIYAQVDRRVLTQKSAPVCPHSAQRPQLSPACTPQSLPDTEPRPT